MDLAPAADVSIALASSDSGEGTVSPTILTFTPTNWATPQTVTVTGTDDIGIDGDVLYSIVTSPASYDRIPEAASGSKSGFGV